MRNQQELEEAAVLVIQNTQNNPERQQQLETFGFGPTRFQQGKTLLRGFEQKLAQQTQRQNEQWALSQQINEGLQAVQDEFKQHARITQIALRDDAALLHALKIDKLGTRRWACVRQAVYFYQQLQQRGITLEAYGVSAKELQQARSAAHQLLELKAARLDKKSEAEHSTQEKRHAQEALRAWVADFRTVARMAFRDQPQTLEAFGIKVRAVV